MMVRVLALSIAQGIGINNYPQRGRVLPLLTLERKVTASAYKLQGHGVLSISSQVWRLASTTKTPHVFRKQPRITAWIVHWGTINRRKLELRAKSVPNNVVQRVLCLANKLW